MCLQLAVSLAWVRGYVSLFPVDITPTPSPTLNSNNYSVIASSSPAPVHTAIVYHSPAYNHSPTPNSIPNRDKSEGRQLSTKHLIIVSSAVAALLLLCILLCLVILLAMCIKLVWKGRRGRVRRTRRGGNPAEDLEISQSGSFISSFTTSLSIRLRSLRPGWYSTVVGHQGSPASDEHPTPAAALSETARRSGEARETGFEDSDYVDMRGGTVDLSCSDSRTDLLQEQSVKLYGNPCYTPTPASKQSVPIPEESLYEDPDSKLGPSGEYAMTVLVPYEYEHPSYEDSNTYKGISDMSEAIYAEVS